MKLDDYELVMHCLTIGKSLCATPRKWGTGTLYYSKENMSEDGKINLQTGNFIWIHDHLLAVEISHGLKHWISLT